MRDSTIGSCRAALFPAAAFVLMLSAEPGYAGEKVTICHFPPGNPENAHTIAVGEPAVDAHLEHGDALGECAEPSSCGDGVVQGTEGCDGTDLGGHTCEDLLGPGATGAARCTEACELASDTCQRCGNAIVEGTEECDDGNTVDRDGCSASCRLPFCGDGIAEVPEECDPPDYGAVSCGEGVTENCCTDTCIHHGSPD